MVSAAVFQGPAYPPWPISLLGFYLHVISPLSSFAGPVQPPLARWEQAYHLVLPLVSLHLDSPSELPALVRAGRASSPAEVSPERAAVARPAAAGLAAGSVPAGSAGSAGQAGLVCSASPFSGGASPRASFKLMGPQLSSKALVKLAKQASLTSRTSLCSVSSLVSRVSAGLVTQPQAVRCCQTPCQTTQFFCLESKQSFGRL